MDLKNKNILAELLQESEHYEQVDDLAKMVDETGTLATIPLYPLYFAIHSATPQDVAHLLPYMSFDQRQLLLDLDSRRKDELNLEQYPFWLRSYALCGDEEVKLEFIKGSHFSLFLKCRFTVSTFDVEEPEYPEESDLFFVTDDQLLLFEFDEEFPYIQEVQELIRHLYAKEGVENAYAILFKLVVDSASEMQEEEYLQRKSRLEDYGVIDYYSSLALHQSFANQKMIDHFIRSKKGASASIENWAKAEVLPFMSVTSYKEKLNNLEEEIAKVTDNKRLDHLRFSFIRLVNASLSHEDALSQGRMMINRVGEKSRAFLKLGFEYVKNHSELRPQRDQEASLFDFFDFIDFFKIGLSLIQLQKNEINKILQNTPFTKDSKEYFLGHYLEELLDQSFMVPAKWQGQIIESFAIYSDWKKNIVLLKELTPYIQKFYETFEGLVSGEKIHDSFYLNYEVSAIDFEAIILSSFAGYILGGNKNSGGPKMGLTLSEAKNFLTMVTMEEASNQALIQEKALSFKQQFGFDKVVDFEFYLFKIMNQQLSGYKLDDLQDEDFKHIGGPIIFSLPQTDDQK